MQIRELEKIKEERKEEEGDFESVCSNITTQSLEMAPHCHIQLNPLELNLFKKLCWDRFKGNFQTHEKNVYSQEIWVEILNEYNRRAEQNNIQQQHCWKNMIRAGKELCSIFCYERVLAEKSHCHPRDPMLLDIFGPCDTCKKRILVFPASLLDLDHKNWDFVMNDRELEEFKKLCVSYSKGEFLAGENLWSVQMWRKFCTKYNEMITDFQRRDWWEMIRAGMKLQSSFSNQRYRGEVDADLVQIFEVCNQCKKRIPIFPTSLINSSSTLGSRTRSNVDVDSRSVRQCIRNCHSDVGEDSTLFDVRNAITLLDDMNAAGLIDDDTLWDLIPLAADANRSLIAYLNSSAPLERKAKMVKVFLTKHK